MSDNLVFGIDLGTTNSCIAVWKDGEVLTIPDENGQKTIPSCVAFTPIGYLVGNAALSQQTANPLNTIVEAKRIIGQNRRYIEKEVKCLLNTMTKEDRPKYEVQLEGQSKLFYPEEISSIILKQLMEIAEKNLGREVRDVVITIPAYFNDRQREATKIAGRIAGLNVLKLIPEPVAAALAFGFDTNSASEEQNILVFDLGGGTFDIAIVSIDSMGSYDVRSTNGNTRLGGAKFTDCLVKFVNSKLQDMMIDTNFGNKERSIVRKACDEAKEQLSNVEETEISVGEQKISITRTKYNSLIMPYIETTIKCVENALEDADLEKTDIHKIVLIGGSTYTPLVRSTIEQFFQKSVSTDINPMEAVAYGACVQAAVLERKIRAPLMYVRNVTPLTVRIGCSEGRSVQIIKRNTNYPTEGKTYGRTSKENQTRVKIPLLEGEQAKSNENRLLGTLILDGLTPSPKGNETVRIIVKIDEKGNISANAIDKKTKNEKSITIERAHEFTREQISEMINTVALLRKSIETQELDDDDNITLVTLKKRMKLEEKPESIEVCPVYGVKTNQVSSIINIELE